MAGVQEAGGNEARGGGQGLASGQQAQARFELSCGSVGRYWGFKAENKHDLIYGF